MPRTRELRAVEIEWHLSGSLAQLRKCVTLASSQVMRHQELCMNTKFLIAFIHEQSKRSLASKCNSGGGVSHDLRLLDADTWGS